MEQILTNLISKQNSGRIYNPASFYVKKRKLIVDWMCEMGEDLRFNPETIHYSVAVFDAYFQLPNIMDHL
jgi:hypothetical protein